MLKRLNYVLVLFFIVALGLVSNVSYAKENTRKIVLSKGDVYQIRLNKKSKLIKKKYSCIKITKKGKVVAKKIGKCTVKVKKGKKVLKYRFIVKKKENNDNNSKPSPEPSPEPSPIRNGNVLPMDNLKIESIQPKDDETCIVRLARNNPEKKFPLLSEEVNYVEIEKKKTDLLQFEAGDVVHLFLIINKNERVITGEVCFITNSPSMLHE